ncbi:hypothetical protein [Teichococcus oryzae]|uniref:Uncharacterized protein n=1 Tax=Teichococcus oryzae TaxID=1608942 RepID=A0A5B2TLV1_9PROT|nr:hypothetical protein [Pseudoroseomonas oryzae]KAA2215093.1 hypothetical protein F0Q34_05360 [Pseudoroseomonas oryzae]
MPRLLPLLILPLLLASGAPMAEPYRRPSAAELESIRRWLCPNGGTPVRGKPGRCDGASSRQKPWDTGLAPPRRDAPAACPTGTKPVLARGHSDIMRCLPS